MLSSVHTESSKETVHKGLKTDLLVSAVMPDCLEILEDLSEQCHYFTCDSESTLLLFNGFQKHQMVFSRFSSLYPLLSSYFACHLLVLSLLKL